MKPKARALQDRAHRFFMDVIAFTKTVPASAVGDEIVPQLLASSGSTASNYRACCKARSKKEFIAKVGVFSAAVTGGIAWLAVIGVLASVVGAYYYLAIVKTMYFDEPVKGFQSMPFSLRFVLAIAGLINILFLAYPGPLLSAATAAAQSLF